MRLTVDNTDVDLSLVTYNDGLNYGRFDAPELAIHDYAAFFPRADFIRLLSASYAKCMTELKHDDDWRGFWPCCRRLATTR